MILLLACRPPAEPLRPLSAEEALSAARASRAEAMRPRSARFAIALVSPKSTVHAQGALLVRPPESFRVEVSGPLGPPQLVVAASPGALAAWLAPKSTRYEATNPAATLAELTGGVAGMDALTALLLGQLAEPTGLAAPTPVAWPPEAPVGWAWTWCVEGGCLRQVLSDRTGKLVAVEATRGEQAVLQATLTPGAVLPEAVVFSLPTLETRAEVRYQSWNEASPADAAFLLTTPPDATVVPLPLGPP